MNFDSLISSLMNQVTPCPFSRFRVDSVRAVMGIKDESEVSFYRPGLQVAGAPRRSSRLWRPSLAAGGNTIASRRPIRSQETAPSGIRGGRRLLFWPGSNPTTNRVLRFPRPSSTTTALDPTACSSQRQKVTAMQPGKAWFSVPLPCLAPNIQGPDRWEWRGRRPPVLGFAPPEIPLHVCRPSIRQILLSPHENLATLHPHLSDSSR